MDHRGQSPVGIERNPDMKIDVEPMNEPQVESNMERKIGYRAVFTSILRDRGSPEDYLAILPDNLPERISGFSFNSIAASFTREISQLAFSL